MNLKPQSSITSTEEDFYRCPGCGESVDRRHVDDVREHHHHVLHRPCPPSWFTARSGVALSRETRVPRSAATQKTADVSAAVRERRYGH